jgi:hypothetical protein
VRSAPRRDRVQHRGGRVGESADDEPRRRVLRCDARRDTIFGPPQLSTIEIDTPEERPRAGPRIAGLANQERVGAESCVEEREAAECETPDARPVETVERSTTADTRSPADGAWPRPPGTAVVRLDAIVESTARPSAPPTCCAVLKSPDARPEPTGEYRRSG